jgi:hypothetical protein
MPAASIETPAVAVILNMCSSPLFA